MILTTGEADAADEWKDGFLFVGNDLALDLLNTRLVNESGPVELLTDTGALVRWLDAAGLLGEAAVRRTVEAWVESQATRDFLAELLAFREALRGAVTRFEAGEAPSHSFERALNTKLEAFPLRYRICTEDGQVRKRLIIEPATPDDLWSGIVDAAASLLSESPAARVRQCEACVVHFRDVSKKGSRRWCSMRLCGNRKKVAAYQQRRRSASRE